MQQPLTDKQIKEASLETLEAEIERLKQGHSLTDYDYVIKLANAMSDQRFEEEKKEMAKAVTLLQEESARLQDLLSKMGK